MSVGIMIEVGDECPIALKLYDEASDQYPQAVVIDNESNILITIDLVHEGYGMYIPATPYVMPDKEFVKVMYFVYTDVTHITKSIDYLDSYDIFRRIIPANYKADVSGIQTSLNNQDIKIDKILGLVHHNIHIDNPVYDSDNNLTGARLRIYSNSVSVGSNANVISDYLITSVGNGAGKFTYWQQMELLEVDYLEFEDDTGVLIYEDGNILELG